MNWQNKLRVVVISTFLEYKLMGHINTCFYTIAKHNCRSKYFIRNKIIKYIIKVQYSRYTTTNIPNRINIQ